MFKYFSTTCSWNLSVDFAIESRLAVLYLRADRVTGRAPVLVQIKGLDSIGEMKDRVGLPAWLAERDVASLVVDQPAVTASERPPGVEQGGAP